jgi:hypothetical protein
MRDKGEAMSNQRPESQFSYTQDELDLHKVIAVMRQDTECLRDEDGRLSERLNDAVSRAESLARQRGMSDAHMDFLKQTSHNKSNPPHVPDEMRSWDEIVEEANAAIPGYVTLEDICSAQDFEDALKHIREIEQEFKHLTGLTKTDVAFIVIAIALQCARQYILQPFLDKNRLTSKQNDKIVKGIVPKSWQGILSASVPYDATRRTDDFNEKTGLSGYTHRYRTLGHDPLLGWFFGPINILSDTLTKSDFITSYNVVDMKISAPTTTSEAIYRAQEQAKVEFNLPVSVARQAIHFGSDYFTKQGLPLPIIGSVNNDVSKFLIQNNINMLNVTGGMALSTLVNSLVSIVHKLFNVEHIAPELYEVRTRKILSISNTVASVSNIVAVAISRNAKVLDLGGLLVTIRRLCMDARFIARAKQEFIEGKLNNEWERISADIDRLCGC